MADAVCVTQNTYPVHWLVFGYAIKLKNAAVWNFFCMCEKITAFRLLRKMTTEKINKHYYKANRF